MPTETTKPDFDTIMNTIVKDTLIVTFIVGFGLIVYGTYKESGDQNAGSMYGLYIIPLVPVILIALGIIQVSKKYLSFKMTWLALLSPVILLVLIAWLNDFEAHVLTLVLLFIVVFSFMKAVLRQLFQ